MSAWQLKFGSTALASQNAQNRTNAIHQWMINNNSSYAQSVLQGQTACWCIPYTSTVIWCINIKDRCLNALTSTEIASLTTISPTAI